jgi:hypothetical protein
MLNMAQVAQVLSGNVFNGMTVWHWVAMGVIVVVYCIFTWRLGREDA